MREHECNPRANGTNPRALETNLRAIRKPSGDPKFDEFWKAYPRKIARGAALKAWQKAVKAGRDPEAIIAGARAYAQSKRDTEPKFLKYPQGWISDERWLDEPDFPSAKGTLYVVGNKRVKITESGERIELDGPIGEETDGRTRFELDAVDPTGNTPMGSMAALACRERSSG